MYGPERLLTSFMEAQVVHLHSKQFGAGTKLKPWKCHGLLSAHLLLNCCVVAAAFSRVLMYATALPNNAAVGSEALL